MTAKFAHTSANHAELEFLQWIRITHPEIFHPMNTKIAAPLIQPTEAEIQHAAYLIWLEDGRPEGRELEHWLTAKEMLCHRHGRDATTREKALEVQTRERRVPARKSAIGSRAGARPAQRENAAPTLANQHS
jgi:hypothetical protein